MYCAWLSVGTENVGIDVDVDDRTTLKFTYLKEAGAQRVVMNLL